MELLTETQKKVNQEIAGNTKTGVDIVGNLASGILERFSGTREVAMDQLKLRLSKMFLGTRRRMR